MLFFKFQLKLGLLSQWNSTEWHNEIQRFEETNENFKITKTQKRFWIQNIKVQMTS